MPVKVTKVACQSCGANLNIDESIRFVTCGYCSASLEIVHDPSAVYSKLLEDVVKRQDAVEDELNILRIERKIQRLEKEWENFRQNVCSKEKDGNLTEPNKAGPVFFGICALVIGLFILIASGSNQEWIGVLLGLGVLFLGYFGSTHGIRRAKEFAAMRSRYLTKLNQLKGDLSSAERKLRFNPMKRSGKTRSAE